LLGDVTVAHAIRKATKAMRNTMKLALASLAAALLLASIVSAASAAHLSSTERTFRAVWTPLTFAESFGFFNVRCNVTMEGSFVERTIAKVVGSVIGDVTSAGVAHPCTGGEGWAWNGRESILGVVQSTSLPWHLTYEGFTTTLPNIATIRLLLVRPKFSISTAVCLSTYQPANLNATANRNTTTGTIRLTPNGESQEQLSGNCGAGAFTGESGTATGAGNATAISVSLI